jgi:radical SAM protein with 4Fe4S-binding SPASM domain
MDELPIIQETFTHQIGQDFKKLPAIYQIEASSACNLKCPMCLRTTNMVRPDQLLDIELLKLMHQRGDFQGSAYIELQMAGEPTLHPKLKDIVEFLQQDVGVMVGLSTHGLSISRKAGLVDTLLALDALTISVDSLDPAIYHQMRYPAKLDQLLTSLHFLFDYLADAKQCASVHRQDFKWPFIELQLIATDMFEGTGNVEALRLLMTENGWDKYAQIRTTGDCFSEMQGRVAEGTRHRNTNMCINPWTTVSVAQNGDVTSCCFIFEPKKDEVNYYGNLYEQSLADIWASDRVKVMREQHMAGATTGQCTKCYLKSPYLIHQNIISRLVRLGR